MHPETSLDYAELSLLISHTTLQRLIRQVAGEKQFPGKRLLGAVVERAVNETSG